MKRFFKTILVSLIISSFGYSALTLTLTTPAGGAIDLGTITPADGFYGSTAGNIELRCETDSAESWSLNASITNELTSVEGYAFNSGSLKWKGYYIDSGGTWTQSDWSAYPISSSGEDTIAVSDGSSPINVVLGTSVYVPSVMPEGDYETTIIYTLTN